MTTKLQKTTLWLTIAAFCLPLNAGSQEQVDMAAATREYEIVPCLLPARVRKLGNMTYPERRRLVEVAARDCRLKGGEYTFYDRAKPEAAVQFFRKMAEGGDADAQVSLGDVYQYLYVDPNYEQAAYWYKQAADAGSSKGKMQLARLYERGLGVEQDTLLATNLWREATGAGEELVLASTLEAAKTAATARINDLTEQLRVSNESAEAARYELATARSEIDNRKQKLLVAQADLAEAQQKLQQAGPNQANTAELAALRLEITQREEVIAEQRDQIDSLEDNLGVQQAQLTAKLRQVERQNRRLNEELANADASADDALQQALAKVDEKDAQIARLQTDLASARSALNDNDSAYEEMLAQLESARAEAGDSKRAQRRVAQLESESEQQLAEIESRKAAIDRLEVQLAAVTSETNQLRSQLDSQINEQAAVEANLASTEAELQRVRTSIDGLQVQLAAANSELEKSSAERDSLRRQLSQGSGDAQTIARLEEQLSIQNKNIELQKLEITKLMRRNNDYAAELTEIDMRRRAVAMRTPMLDTSSIKVPRNVKIGTYHALVIGNNDYQYLTDLENAESDARAVHELLQREYGFNSTLLIDGSEDEMFGAFLTLGEQLEENDLVLIYYAGHGFRSKNESYWLPVELDSRAKADVNGISSLKVADWVRAMPAKHVMIVADSCYSGSGIQTTGGYRYDLATLEASLPYFLKSKSRTMLTSGDVAPVMDGGGEGQHSVFTSALLGLLSENKGILHAGALHDYLVERVKYASDGMRVNQTPKFGSIESAGHENGQFVFMHRDIRT